MTEQETSNMDSPFRDAKPADEIPGTPLHAELSPDEVVATRDGQVLLRHTILKSDHFPGCQNMRLTPLLDGAPNFRQVPDLPVYGVAIPTVSGVRRVLDTLGAWKGRRKVLWHNMREEPVIYINGRPYVVREADKPFANLEYTGINGERVEDMEARLKQDVLAEAGKYNGAVMVAHEDDEFQVIQEWEPVSEVDVQTPLEVYEELKKEGYDVDYLRVPVTDEKAPEKDDFEILISRCWEPPSGAALVFNCQMGRGRTTTGMVIGSILHLKQIQPQLQIPSEPVENLPSWFVSNDENNAEAVVGEDAELKAGRYGVVRSLLRALEHGKEAKSALDAVLDACSAMQNLREAIATYRNRIYYEANDNKKQGLLQVCLEYLERYYVLIAFTAYLGTASFQPGQMDHVTFEEWITSRPELKGILLRLLRSNPLAALALDRSSAGDKPSLGEGDATEEAEVEATYLNETHEELIAKRDGSVLGPHTILKQDHFQGCQSSRLPPTTPDAPNFRQVPGMQVFGGAMPTVDGVKAVLDSVGAGPGGEGGADSVASCRAVWHIMREEPVIYINGQPYVLREDSRPFKNLLEYRGIDAARLGQMEERLKDDVEQEAAKFDGKILVTREANTNSGPRTLREEFLALEGVSAVQTPEQVFRELQALGYQVQLVRVPLTDGTCPRPADFDVFYASAAAAAPSDALIYTCQLGGGRTTMGTAIGSLLRIYLNGASLPVATEVERQSTLAHMDEDVEGASSPRVSRGFDDAVPSRLGEENGEGVDEKEEESPAGNNNKLSLVSNGSAVYGLVIGGGGKVQNNNHNGAGAGTTPFDAETRNLLDGEYVGVRRFVRTLEGGLEAKTAVDCVVDACAVLINLRTSIMRYRKPKSTDTFFRPEIRARHIAFQRGSAYLERYCMLIAFAVYLQQCRQRGRQLTFAQWLLARPDVTQARDAIHLNPAGALAPVPAVMPYTPAVGLPAPAGTPIPSSSIKDVPLEEQRQVLAKRRGTTIGRRSILKSVVFGDRPITLKVPVSIPQAAAAGTPRAFVPPKMTVVSLEGVSDLRKADTLPVYTVGNATVTGLRRMLDALGAGPSGSMHVVLTDLREELVIYINGVAYLRRELEMPAAALHHAGIQAAKLEDLERRLRVDMMSECAAWGGKLLLHRELSGSNNNNNGGGNNLSAAIGRPLKRTNSKNTANSSTNHGDDDITQTTEYQPTARVLAFWETALGGSEIDQGMCSPGEVFTGLAAEGYRLTYRRVPMSRERTPRPDDLVLLHLQMEAHPGPKATYVFVSRTAAGSSARFAAAFACELLQAAESSARMTSPRGRAALFGESPRAAMYAVQYAPDVAAGSPDGATPSLKRIRSNISNHGLSLTRADSEMSADMTRSLSNGEYRGIMNLCRLLPGGAEAKAAVDDAIDASTAIGNLREDIHRCKEAAEVDGEEGLTGQQTAAAAAARRLGLHYLQRYFFMIAFRGYLDWFATAGKQAPLAGFTEWMAERKELTYLLSTLELE